MQVEFLFKLMPANASKYDHDGTYLPNKIYITQSISLKFSNLQNTNPSRII